MIHVKKLFFPSCFLFFLLGTLYSKQPQAYDFPTATKLQKIKRRINGDIQVGYIAFIPTVDIENEASRAKCNYKFPTVLKRLTVDVTDLMFALPLIVPTVLVGALFVLPMMCPTDIPDVYEEDSASFEEEAALSSEDLDDESSEGSNISEHQSYEINYERLGVLAPLTFLVAYAVCITLFFGSYYRYYIYSLTSPMQATPGAHRAGLRVVTRSGGRLTTKQAIARFFLSFVFFPIFPFNILWAAHNRNSQMMQDYMVGCYVVEIVSKELEEDVLEALLPTRSGRIKESQIPSSKVSGVSL